MRRRLYGKTRITAEEAEQLFRLNDELADTAGPEWAVFFVEALTDYVVNQAEPQGYVSEPNADWLIARISHSGRVEAATELELLVEVLEQARMSPVRLVAFALEQVKLGVVYGEGVVGQAHRLRPGAIDAGEVELLRRILYAFGGDGHIAITRQEAEILLDINDLTAEADNAPSWSDLFVKAMANFLLVSSGYRAPTRQEALRREQWLDEPAGGVAGFLSRMLSDGMGGLLSAYVPEGEDDANEMPADPIADAAADANIAWLAARIGSTGRLHANEIALIDFLKTEHGPLHPRFAPLLDRAVAA